MSQRISCACFLVFSRELVFFVTSVEEKESCGQRTYAEIRESTKKKKEMDFPRVFYWIWASSLEVEKP